MVKTSHSQSVHEQIFRDQCGLQPISWCDLALIRIFSSSAADRPWLPNSFSKRTTQRERLLAFCCGERGGSGEGSSSDTRFPPGCEPCEPGSSILERAMVS